MMLPPGSGRVIGGGGLNVILKVPGGDPAVASTFEIVVPPGFDVGAHVHSAAQELFYVLEGELDLLAFEPQSRSQPDWHEWRSRSGQRFLRGGPGSLLFIPPGCPHAFANPTKEPARVLFQAAPSGHEDYLDELAAMLRAAEGRPDPDKVAELRRRYDIEQLTILRNPVQHGHVGGRR
jgi:oxalate decarboxylase/phosphoglucose isomerase-like protein (cupin superfamily)